jgi:formamidopyrimidine-DNA glycosylase
MPELPEVENLRMGLERFIIGQKIRSVKVTKPKLVSGKGTLRTASIKKQREFIDGVTGGKFLAVERRAKNLVFRLSHDKIIIVHLKMSGQFVYISKNISDKVIGGHPIELSETKLPNKHTHVTFELESGVLYYNDTRMFGYLLYYPNLKAFENENHFGSYGVEPLSKDFTIKYLSAGLKNKKGKIKAVLMDQKIVTGLGNIYADESLFESGIRPDRNASSLSKTEVQSLYKAIVRIITRAVKVGGSSVATYKLLDNTKGNYAREHKVYGKDGEKCSKCKTPLRKIIVGGRTTIFCPKCQK